MVPQSLAKIIRTKAAFQYGILKHCSTHSGSVRTRFNSSSPNEIQGIAAKQVRDYFGRKVKVRLLTSSFISFGRTLIL